MAYNPSSPVTGAAQTGLTSPTYTLTADVAPNSNSKQHAVTALGGTQTGVITNTVAAPFTLTFERPFPLRVLGTPNPVTGVISSVPRNVWVLRVRKGVLPLVGQPYQICLIETRISVPAGADTVDAANIRAALSLHIGALDQVSAGIGDSTASGVM
jgi:hypothetical protein